jgi:prephenate dehydrogenase
MNITIIGLGLMGGSLGFSLKKLPFIKNVFGFDHNKHHQARALEIGFVDKLIAFEEVLQSDVIFLAIPVNGIIASLQELKEVKPTATIIDLGSTKHDIVNHVPQQIRKNFIAAHPMTGTEKFGPDAAIEKLYDNKIVVLCNLEYSGEQQQEVAKKIFTALNMKLIYMDAKDHDNHAAYISHLPHLISFALANSVLSQEDPKKILELAAGGFKDMSRLAKSSPHMWADIFKQNRTHVLEAVQHFKKELDQFETYLKEHDFKSLHEAMDKANSLHDIF